MIPHTLQFAHHDSRGQQGTLMAQNKEDEITETIDQQNGKTQHEDASASQESSEGPRGTDDDDGEKSADEYKDENKSFIDNLNATDISSQDTHTSDSNSDSDEDHTSWDSAIEHIEKYDVTSKLNAHLSNGEPLETNAQPENEPPITPDITTHAKSLEEEIAVATNIPHPSGAPAPDQEGNPLFITSNRCFKTALTVMFRRMEQTPQNKTDVDSAIDELMEYMETLQNKTSGVYLYRKSESFRYSEISATQARKVVEGHNRVKHTSKTSWRENTPDKNVTDPDNKEDVAEGDTK